jgi:acyl-CoA synthetase (AMP-forming)/AMP-acid ligase II
VIRGEHNIFPKENQHLHTNHSTESCQFLCCGIPQARLGKEICAGIRIKPGSNITFENILQSCKGQCAYFKIPSKAKIMNQFPGTRSEKNQKFKLKKTNYKFSLKNTNIYRYHLFIKKTTSFVSPELTISINHRSMLIIYP